MNDFQEKILTCKMCGYQAKQLFQHIKSVHKVSVKEYRNQYGSNEIMQIGFAPPVVKKIDPVASDRAKESYKNIGKKLELVDAYTPEHTRFLLVQNDFYKNFLGKTKQRTLLKQDIRLYKSIFQHTAILNSAVNMLPHKGFSKRVKFIVEHDYDLNKLACGCGAYTFSTICRKCVLRMAPVDWIKIKHPDNWSDHFEKKITTDNKLLGLGYSKISQRLFDSIMFLMDKKLSEQIYYATNKGEWKIFLCESERKLANQWLYCLDFKFGNKNIEFDSNNGRFPKSELYTNTRDAILKERGFEILRVEESDYTNDPDSVIRRCIEFLLDTQ